ADLIHASQLSRNATPSFVGRRNLPPASGRTELMREYARRVHLSLRSRREYLRPPRSEGRVGRSHQRHSGSQLEGNSPSYLQPPIRRLQGPSSRKREDRINAG